MKMWNKKWFVRLAASAALLSAAAVAWAGDWHIVGGDAYKGSDGSWHVWLSDGDGNHITLKRNSKKKAKAAGDGAVEALNADPCVDPCMFDPSSCFPGLSTALSEDVDWELVGVVQGDNGNFTARAENDYGQSVAFTRATAGAAATRAQEVADAFNADQCVVF